MDDQITLTLEGSRAAHGVSLSDFESFIESFLGALRDYDRSRRGAPTRKPGRFERRAEAVTAFRLVRFEPGSGIATIEPERIAVPEGAELPVNDLPIALENLRALSDDIDAATGVPEDVSAALGKACLAFGANGSIRIDFPMRVRNRPGRIDLPSLERLAHVTPAAHGEVRAVSGRLHLLDVEPDKLAIRTSSGIDWICKYPQQLETKVTRLMGMVVWAEGSGHLTSPQRGTMTLERIEPVDQGNQSTLFTQEPIPDATLLASQGITGPQGLAGLADAEWDDETDYAYLAALTGA